MTDAELPAELKHFYNQYAKTFLKPRSGAARTASTAASQGGTALLAMDFLVRPSLPPTPALPLALPTQTCPRPPHPPSDLTFRAQDQAGAELKAVRPTAQVPSDKCVSGGRRANGPHGRVARGKFETMHTQHPGQLGRGPRWWSYAMARAPLRAGFGVCRGV